MRRLWYYAAWTMTEPWSVGLSAGGDEFGRETVMLALGPLGRFVWAKEDDRWKEWIQDAVDAKLLADEPEGEQRVD